jgi:phosphatidylglycerophosphate synthase
MAMPIALRIRTEDPGPRFLGLTVSERNARVARRAMSSAISHPPSAISHEPSAMAPILTVPSGVAITPALIAALPPPAGTWHLVWDAARAPIVWSAADVSSATAPNILRVPENTVLDVSTPATRRRSAWRLLRASGKPTDGWLSRHIHRKISRLFSYLLLHLRLTPNAATLLTFGVGGASAWLAAQTSHATMALAALLFWFASIADGIDGEMARLTLRESLSGDRLDTVVDQATYVTAFIGLIVGCWRQGTGAAGWTILAGGAMGVPILLLWAEDLARLACGPHAVVFVAKPIEVGVIGAAAATGAPALRLASGVFRLLRRESFSLAFFLVALVTGRRIVFPALLAGGVAFVTATLVVYREPIVRAMQERYSAGALQMSGGLS